jgi:PTS system mannitol-specific IIC component
MRDKLQHFGRLMSRMVMPNISAFIAWGVITALFTENGWFPNESLSHLIEPLIFYGLPMLIAYTGGRLVEEKRGGVVAVVATIGLTVGSQIPMFIGAMIMGPLSGWLLKRLEQFWVKHTPLGFEMLVSNFICGLLAAGLSILSYLIIGPMIITLMGVLRDAVQVVVSRNLLFLSALFIEPGKILFLNNAINHGILSPLGLQDVVREGRSVFFLLETNPGPGLGILAAYWFAGSGTVKKTAPGAIVIHFFGGIHEIYFPYVLMCPSLFFAAILGGMSGILVFQLTGAGLIFTPSPGSIFTILTMTPKGAYLPVLSGIAISTAVSFVSGSLILHNKVFEEASLPEVESLLTHYTGGYHVSKIYFACDAGMGSSAMGASMLSKILEKNGVSIPVENVSIDGLPASAEVVVTYEEFIPIAKKRTPEALHVAIRDFLDRTIYEQLAETLIAHFEMVEVKMEKKKPNEILMRKNIVLGHPSVSMDEAIEFAGRLLYESGYVEEPYIAGMHQREEKFSTYIGSGVAIPHGENEVKDKILESGIVVVQYPDGVDFGGGNIAKIVIGIAGKGNEHLQILANIAESIEEESILNQLLTTKDSEYIYNLFSSEEMFGE